MTLCCAINSSWLAKEGMRVARKGKTRIWNKSVDVSVLVRSNAKLGGYCYLFNLVMRFEVFAKIQTQMEVTSDRHFCRSLWCLCYLIDDIPSSLEPLVLDKIVLAVFTFVSESVGTSICIFSAMRLKILNSRGLRGAYFVVIMLEVNDKRCTQVCRVPRLIFRGSGGENGVFVHYLCALWLTLYIPSYARGPRLSLEIGRAFQSNSD